MKILALAGSLRAASINAALLRAAARLAPPGCTVTLLSLGFVFSGAITIEYVFSWPGLGWLTVQAIDSKDFPLLQGLFLLFSAAVIIANLIADVLYSYLDPRVRAA